MELTKELKQQLDNMSYRDMLEKWRYAPVGAAVFQGESGEYFRKVMLEKKEKVNHVAASKDVGWGS